MTQEGSELQARIAEGAKPQVICDLLDRMSHEGRVAATRALDRRAQKTLYRLVDGFRPVTLLDMVPAHIAPLTAVRHHGKNSMPMFTLFEKRFYRAPDQDPKAPEQLGGANFQSIQWLTGPGYFVAVPSKEKPEVLVDYYRVPSIAPEGFMKIVPNGFNRSGLVYGSMIDTLRRVSEHVTIGSAAKHGKDIGAFFVLVREDA
jgi:hypothetical protein